MSKPVFNGPPPPEEFQRQLSDFLRQHFQNNRGSSSPQSAPMDTAEPEEAPGSKAGEFEFKHKPRDVKAYLDRFVIKQDEAKKVLSVALCDHYHHVRLALEGKESSIRQAKHHLIGRPAW
jgi:ATP-dependent protease Clp ATPase subunit